MEIYWSSIAEEDYLFWKKTDKKIKTKIDLLLEDIQKNPYKGLGKPEPLKYEAKGFWSRRIDKKHRLVYVVANEIIHVIQCRYHYQK